MKRIILILLTFSTGILLAQNEALTVRGYVKFLPQFNRVNQEFLPPGFENLFPSSFEDYQIHNRVDIHWYGKNGFRAGIGLRNRLFWGYQVDNNPAFYNNLQNDPGFLDASFAWQNESSIISVLSDRFWIEWEREKWRIRAGRQRINWGVSTVWNPNDIFNQFNYFDFDYEERPGSDALLAQYYTGDFSSIQLAVAPADSVKDLRVGGLYKFHKGTYDLQILGGYVERNYAMGGAFAGNLWDAGLKGEFTYFIPAFESLNEEQSLVATLGIDYSFANGIYLQGGYLFNQGGNDEGSLLDLLSVTQTTLSTKNIFPYKNSIFASALYPVTPLLSASASTIFTPNLQNVFLIPNLQYNLAQNLDILALGQLFLGENPNNGEVGLFFSAIYLRLKYSF
ncbi:MAG: hypothetical protein LPK46_12240 [Bacteroidota bacterium]|nr:hypothetical protein [Bacteroidota bacterium]MDX5506897.1 hypothetical protein [Bacteroidota bacterium]